MLLFHRKQHIFQTNDILLSHCMLLFLLYSLYSIRQETKCPFDYKYSRPILLPQRNCQCKDYLKEIHTFNSFHKNTLTSSDLSTLFFHFYYFTLYHTQMQKNVLTCDIAPYNVLKCGLTKINNNNLSLQNMQTISE